MYCIVNKAVIPHPVGNTVKLGWKYTIRNQNAVGNGPNLPIQNGV
jgi:hypothetical protein